MILTFGALSVGGLLGFHTYLTLTNQTTWEVVSRDRISYLRGVTHDTHPFDKGTCGNVAACVRSYPDEPTPFIV